MFSVCMAGDVDAEARAAIYCGADTITDAQFIPAVDGHVACGGSGGRERLS
jgi:hypothetical protein